MVKCAFLVLLLVACPQFGHGATQTPIRTQAPASLGGNLPIDTPFLVPTIKHIPEARAPGLAAAQLGSKSHFKGAVAVSQLARNSTRARKIARNHKISVATLRARLANDNDLAVDINNERLVYVCGGLGLLPDNKAARLTDVTVFEDPSEPHFTNAFTLHSRPGSRNIIYLDFDGHSAAQTAWRPSGTIITPPYSIDDDPAFSDEEMTNIVVSRGDTFFCMRVHCWEIDGSVGRSEDHEAIQQQLPWHIQQQQQQWHKQQQQQYHN
jgi:hypothetical protein